MQDTLMAFAMTSGSLSAMRDADAILPAVIGGKSAAGANPSGKCAAGSHCIPQSTTVLGRNHHHMKTKKLLAALLTLLIFLSPTFAAAETVVTFVLSHLPLRSQPHAGHRRHHHPQPRRAEHRLSA